MVRYTIWVLPTLGFVGTVLGISQALRFAGAANPRDPTLLHGSRRFWPSSSTPRSSPVAGRHTGSRPASHPALRGGGAQQGRPVLHRQSDQPAAQRVTGHAQRGAQLVRVPQHVDARPVPSILGTFVLITFVLLPYYLRQPSLESDIAQAEAETSALADELRLQREKLSATQAARSEAERTLAAAQDRLASAKPWRPQASRKSRRSRRRARCRPRSRSATSTSCSSSTPPAACATSRRHAGQSDRRDQHPEPPVEPLRIGVVAYKDRGERYVTRDFPLRRWKARGRADPGFRARPRGERRRRRPEPVDLALKVATS